MWIYLIKSSFPCIHFSFDFSPGGRVPAQEALIDLLIITVTDVQMVQEYLEDVVLKVKILQNLITYLTEENV